MYALGQRNLFTLVTSQIQDSLQSKKNVFSLTALADGILNGDVTSLAKGITLVKSTLAEHNEKAFALIEKCMPHRVESIRIGITGVPGVGKSTFIEAFGKLLTSKGKKVAILAVDPTSSISKGSILGDKTRMNELSKDSLAFIRPSAAGQTLGGVAKKTRESIFLCEAAGYEIILVETVGVGQSEVAVHSMVDFFLLLKLAGAGDELQGIKRGVIEMADAIVINKADGENKKSAERAKAEFARALHLYPPKANQWIPKVMTCSALKNEGISEIWQLIEGFSEQTKEKGHFQKNRQNQNLNWFQHTIEDALTSNFYQNQKIKAAIEPFRKKIMDNQISASKAARQLVEEYLSDLE